MKFSVIIAILTITAISGAMADNILRIDNGKKQHRIPVLSLNGVRYVEFAALSRSVGYYRAPDECILPPYRMRWSAPGFFALVEGPNVQIYQAPYPALMRGGGIIVPLDECLNILERIRAITWSAPSMVVRVQPKNRLSHEQGVERSSTPPRGYQLPPRLRRPSIETLQRDFHSMIEYASPLLASSARWLPRSADSIAYVTALQTQFFGDTTRITFLMSSDVPSENIELRQKTAQIHLYLRGVGCERTVLLPLSKIRLRRYGVERHGNTSVVTLTLQRTDRIARVYHRAARQLVLEISPRSRLHPVAQRWSLDCVVLDPGHGGHDVGAVGIGNVQEKVITLAVARRIARLLRNELPTIRVLLTRDSDRFVELHRRCDIANAAKGKLFVSLHCNAAPTKPHPARGAEVYVLSPARTDEAAAVAARENASIRYEADSAHYRKWNVEQRILATVAQHGFLELSHRLAWLLDSTLSVTLRQPTRSVQSAGFLVLVGAAMPSVLVEMGFLTHPQESQLLQRSTYQEKIARAIAHAIVAYVREYERMVALYGTR